MIGLPRSYIKDRGWSMSYLGPVRNDSHRHVYCARLAMMKGFDHFSWMHDQCYSSYAMPANVYKMEDDWGSDHQSSIDNREFIRPFFMKGMSKLSLPSKPVQRFASFATVILVAKQRFSPPCSVTI